MERFNINIIKMPNLPLTLDKLINTILMKTVTELCRNNYLLLKKQDAENFA